MVGKEGFLNSFLTKLLQGITNMTFGQIYFKQERKSFIGAKLKICSCHFAKYQYSKTHD